MGYKRQAKGRPTSVYLSEKNFSLTNEVCDESGMSRSELINNMIDSAELDKLLKKDGKNERKES
jgi:hypothetical protein